MDVWFSIATAERHERELKYLRILCTRFSEVRRESFYPLDINLSWTLANRKLSWRAVAAARSSTDTRLVCFAIRRGCGANAPRII